MAHHIYDINTKCHKTVHRNLSNKIIFDGAEDNKIKVVR